MIHIHTHTHTHQNTHTGCRPLTEHWLCSRLCWFQNNCRRLRGHLVSMHNSVEYSQVLCLAFRANTHKDHFWIGGRSKYLWHSFQWTDNTPFHFARWGFMQLDMVSGEECVEMNYKQWGLWNNAVCSGRKYYVCARRSWSSPSSQDVCSPEQQVDQCVSVTMFSPLSVTSLWHRCKKWRKRMIWFIKGNTLEDYLEIKWNLQAVSQSRFYIKLFLHCLTLCVLNHDSSVSVVMWSKVSDLTRFFISYRLSIICVFNVQVTEISSSVCVHTEETLHILVRRQFYLLHQVHVLTCDSFRTAGICRIQKWLGPVWFLFDSRWDSSESGGTTTTCESHDWGSRRHWVASLAQLYCEMEISDDALINNQ